MRKILTLAALLLAATPMAALATPYQDCVTLAVTLLDDKISPADVIAGAAVEDCKGEIYKTKPDFRAKPEAMEYLIDGLKKRAVVDVLYQRQKTRLIGQLR